MAQATASAGAEFMIKSLEMLREIAMRQEFLTADDLRRAYADAGLPYYTPASGSALLNGARRGYYHDTGRSIKTEVPTSHNRGLAIWESLIFTGQRLYGSAKNPKRRWVLKAPGLPGVQFVERATALEWILPYMEMCRLDLKTDQHLVQITAWLGVEEEAEPLPGEQTVIEAPLAEDT